MPVKEINKKELEKWQNNGREIEVIDVRTAQEFSEGHIENSKNIPMDVIQENYDKIDWKKTVVFVCRSGSRSMMVARYFSNENNNVYNLRGGIIG